MLWKEQCEKEGIERESGFDEFRYVYQITSMVPRGQFYLRPKNSMQFIFPGANVKFNPSWKDEWVVVEGDWDRSVYLDGAEYLVPTQFSPKDKWSIDVLSTESRRILKKIQDRNYTNLKYPTCDPFKGTRLERYLRISIARPGRLCFLSFLLSPFFFLIFILFFL